MRVLDEVAEAIQAARRRGPDPVLSAFGLEEQFGRPLGPREWAALQKSLECILPLLEFVQGHWFLPIGLETVWDLVERVSRCRPEWEQPAACDEAAWRDAQIFVGVCRALVDAGGLDKKDVVRSARFKRDLGLECRACAL